MFVSGETGLPAARKVDRAIQMTDVNSEGYGTASLTTESGDDELMHHPFLHDNGMNTDAEMMHQGNNEDCETNDEMNHEQKDPANKIDLTQDSDSDDSIVEVGEVKEEPGLNQGVFKQEQGYAGGANMYTHPTPYQCGVCQKAFDNLQVLENHNKIAHASGSLDEPRTVPMATGRTAQEQQEAMLSFKLEPNRYVILIFFKISLGPFQEVQKVAYIYPGNQSNIVIVGLLRGTAQMGLTFEDFMHFLKK